MTNTPEKIVYTAHATTVGGRQGTAKTDDGLLDLTLTAPKELGGPGTGTNPEELLAAAHAGCFSMQLSAMLAGDGHPPDDVQTEATCEMVRSGPGFRISTMRLKVTGKVAGINQAVFGDYVTRAADLCPLSGIMKGNVEIVHEATLL